MKREHFIMQYIVLADFEPLVIKRMVVQLQKPTLLVASRDVRETKQQIVFGMFYLNAVIKIDLTHMWVRN